jgi:hypothetical protein
VGEWGNFQFIAELRELAELGELTELAEICCVIHLDGVGDVSLGIGSCGSDCENE